MPVSSCFDEEEGFYDRLPLCHLRRLFEPAAGGQPTRGIS